MAGVGQAEWAAPGVSTQELMERLIARCRKKPVVVLVDEAHMLTRDVGQLLLNLSQDVRASAPCRPRPAPPSTRGRSRPRQFRSVSM